MFIKLTNAGKDDNGPRLVNMDHVVYAAPRRAAGERDCTMMVMTPVDMETLYVQEDITTIEACLRTYGGPGGLADKPSTGGDWPR